MNTEEERDDQAPQYVSPSKVRPTFRDGIDNFPTLPPPRVTNTLEVGERNRRAERYAGIVDMLLGFPDTDRDYIRAMTYSELLAFAIEALQAERVRIK